jgi:two-component system, NtrC family, sensor kinase
LNLAKNIPLIMGEADTLSQVFLNLILNAVEFSPAGKTIDINSEMDGNASVKVTIKDEGCGIAPQNLGKIFKPFYTTKPAGMGTGLGLPISLRIIKSLGGEIHVESQPKKGSTFTLSLPVYREPSIT